MKPPDDDDDALGNGDRHWHVSRGIPVAFIVSMLIYSIAQAGLFGWWASAMNYRVEAVEKAQLSSAPQGERLTRVEERLTAVQTGITDIKAILQAAGKPR